MADFVPDTPYTVPAILLLPKTETVKGSIRKNYEEGDLFFCSFRTFGGTEAEMNGLKVIENTAVVETWYRPDIKNNNAIRVNGIDYEIISPPENIKMKNQFMKFKVRAIKGGA